MNKKVIHSSLLAALVVAVGALLPAAQAQGKSFPDTPLQIAASRPAANIMFILDDSGSMAWDYMPDGMNSNELYRKNPWVNPLAYDSTRTYRTWRSHDGTPMTGGTSYASVYSDNARLRTTRNLRNGTEVFFYPKNTSLAKGDTTHSNYYRFSISFDWRGSGTVTRCESRTSWFSVTWDSNCQTGAHLLPSGRSLGDELENYATWYSYHRTRMKVAKYGVLDAFSQMPSTIRVGYDSIWNRSPLNIPVQSDDGLFRGNNKQVWFDRIINAQATGGTPLHGALRRAGEYFSQSSRSGPWGPESGSDQFSCRQNFAILTSDGYWNDNTGYGSRQEVGNADGTRGEEITSPTGETYRYEPRRPYMDSHTDTLADVAMHYWKTDLREDLDNNVPASPANPAFWQHMSTFSISIGLSGEMDPERDLLSLSNGSKSWPDPWRRGSSGSRSWSNESPRRIDDLWHAAVNGRGEFNVANDPDKFVDSMKSTLASIQKVLSSGSNVSTSSTSLQTDTRVFHATYFSGVWTGELSAYDLSDQGIAQDPSWLGSEGISFSNRKVFTASARRSGTTFPTSSQETQMQDGLEVRGINASKSDIADYIKGRRTREVSNGGILRNRETVLGDIVNSSPVYSSDTDTLYVGANDGMLHAFNATTGVERFAYVPRGLDFRALGTLAHPDYEHKFFVDGPVVVSAKSQTPGKNYLVGAPGRGAKGIFALDVTSPGSFSSSSVLWDRTEGVDNDMGYVISDMLIANTNSNDQVVLVPNGLDSQSGRSVLFVYRLSDGALLRKIDTGAGGGNGLSAPRGWDVDGDGKVDVVYAGDIKGNLWKFDFSSPSPNQWKVDFDGEPLFRARDANGNPQPITSGVALAREAFGDRRWVLFGTGRYIAQADITDVSSQTVYGIIDGETRVNNRSRLTERDIALMGTDARGNALRAFETHSSLPAGSRGWYIDLSDPYDGERVIERGFVSGRVFTFPSVIPISGNACEASGRGFINAIDAFTGTSVSSDGQNHPYFDVGQDGNEANDWLGQGQNRLPVGSLETGVGMVTRPVLVGDRLVYGGSSGGKESQRVRLPPPSPKRLYWRELIRE